jgi:hypothetical protein
MFNGGGRVGYLFGPNTGVIVGCISSSSDHFPVEYPAIYRAYLYLGKVYICSRLSSSLPP